MTDLPVSVEILMSTYNGAAFLDAQLKSIVAQSFTEWSLLVRDDGSTDGTLAVLDDWLRREPRRIRLLREERTENLGAVRSFSRLLQHCTAPYVMFADQDDVWLSDKVQVTLGLMLREEADAGSAMPILVHTDLAVTDGGGRPLGPSLWRRQGVAQSRSPPFSRLMVENCAWGCTMMLNRPLSLLARGIPAEARYHDWWITLVAAAFGQIVPLRRATILYRRHGRNESGISSIAEVARAGLLDWRAARRRTAELLGESRPRVAAFLDRFGERMAVPHVAAAEAFLRLAETGPLTRRLDILRRRLFFSGLPRTLGMLLLI